MQHILNEQVRRARIDGSYGIAYDIARDELACLLPAVALARVLREADHDPVLYDALALHWIGAGIVERRLTLHDVGWAADRFDEARAIERRGDAAGALRKLAG